MNSHARLLLSSARSIVGVGVLAALVACHVDRRPSASAPEPEPPAPKAKTATFGWQAGDAFALVYAMERKGNRIEIHTDVTVTAEGSGGLRIHFDAPKIADRDRKLVAPGKSHAYLDVWPDLVVDPATGELRAIEANLAPEAKEAVQHRWDTWTALVGDDLPVGESRSGKGEADVGEGLIVPMTVEESHAIDPAAGHRYVITRTYEGEQTRKLWLAMLAEVGAPRKDIDAVLSASREEKLTVVTDPGTLRHTRVVSRSVFTVKSRGGRADRTDVHAESDDFGFTWR